MQSPRPRLDPLALVVLGVAAAIAIGGAAWLFFALRAAPVAAPSESPVEAVKRLFRNLDPRAPSAPPRAAPARPAGKAPAGAPAPRVGIELAPGRTWTYAVRLEPEVWRDAVLEYRAAGDKDGTTVNAEFRHAAGKMSFRLGTYAAGHPSHAYLRFPGFFMHGAYLDFPLQAGKRFAWEYPWQGQDRSVKPGRVRRFDAVVGATETVSVPAGRFEAIRIDTTLRYIDAGRTHASVNEVIWYAPSLRQIVKVVRAGDSPDESAKRIVADLAEVR